MNQLQNPKNNNLIEKLETNLRLVFGKLPTFLSDSPELVNWLKSSGFKTFGFDEKLSPEDSENVVLIPTDDDKLPPYTEWNRLFKKSRVLLIPLLSFSPKFDDAIYTLNLLAKSDLQASTENNKKVMKMINERRKPMILRGNGCDIVCELEEDIYVMRPKTEVDLSPGEWESLGSYFEVGMVPDSEDFRPGFIVNGTLSVPGVAMA